MRLVVGVVVLLGALVAVVGLAEEGGGGGDSADPESCAGCHRERQPGILAAWDAGVHAQEEVLCGELGLTKAEMSILAEGGVV